MEEGNRFEEVDDAFLEEWAGEIKEERDCSFAKMYGPIRALFATDSVVLSKFEDCLDHMERLSFLLNMEVVRNSLADIATLRDRPKDENIPQPTDEKKPPRKDLPQLSYGANKKYPHLSKAIEVKSSKSEGRYMVAKQKIVPGDVLVVEPAFSTSLFREFYSTHCLHCFETIKENPVCCPGCPTVNFCCELCLRLGWPLHQWECPVLEFTDSKDIGHMATLAYRLVAGQNYNYLINNMERFESEEASYKEGDYLAAYKQESNMDPRPSGDHLKRCVMGLILARCLQLSGWFPEDQRQKLDSKEVMTITALLVRHIQANASNAYEINELVREGSSMIDCHAEELGGAVYPTISLSNHACSSNTSRSNVGTSGVWRALKTIFPNEKVYDNYGRHYHVESKENRQQMLAAQYFFDCNCPACKEDWPVYRDLARREASFHCASCNNWIGSNVEKVKKCKKCKKDLTAIVKVSRKLQELSKDFRMIMDTISEESAHQQIKHISSLLQEVEKVCKPPCKELITCQQVLIQCFAMLGNTVKVEIPAEKAQLVPFTGGASYSDDEEDSEDEFDMPGLI